MNQLNNKTLDTFMGVSGTLAEADSSQLGPLVSQKKVVYKMSTITEQTCKDIMRKKKSLDDFSKAEQKQIFNLMFGEEFMESNDKGSLKKY